MLCLVLLLKIEFAVVVIDEARDGMSETESRPGLSIPLTAIIRVSFKLLGTFVTLCIFNTITFIHD